MLDRAKRVIPCLIMLLAAGAAVAQPGVVLDGKPVPAVPVSSVEVAVLETSMGTMTFRLLADGAPQTVANFTRLVRAGFYDGKPFYRVAAGHVIQAGDGGENEQPKVPGELAAHAHVEGALGLARDADPDSGSTEIYICLAARPHLDGSYAVFGLLEDGVEVLRAIGAVRVTEKWIGKVAMHEPVEPVIIERAYLERRQRRD